VGQGATGHWRVAAPAMARGAPSWSVVTPLVLGDNHPHGSRLRGTCGQFLGVGSWSTIERRKHPARLHALQSPPLPVLQRRPWTQPLGRSQQLIHEGSTVRAMPGNLLPGRHGRLVLVVRTAADHTLLSDPLGCGPTGHGGGGRAGDALHQPPKAVGGRASSISVAQIYAEEDNDRSPLESIKYPDELPSGLRASTNWSSPAGSVDMPDTNGTDRNFPAA